MSLLTFAHSLIAKARPCPSACNARLSGARQQLWLDVLADRQLG